MAETEGMNAPLIQPTAPEQPVVTQPQIVQPQIVQPQIVQPQQPQTGYGAAAVPQPQVVYQAPQPPQVVQAQVVQAQVVAVNYSTTVTSRNPQQVLCPKCQQVIDIIYIYIYMCKDNC